MSHYLIFLWYWVTGFFFLGSQTCPSHPILADLAEVSIALLRKVICLRLTHTHQRTEVFPA